MAKNTPAHYVLGMDLGTSSLKCVVIDKAGRVLATAERHYPTQSPQSGWMEQDPEDWVEALRAALTELRTREPELLNSLTAIGICSAAHIPVLLDDHNRVIRPAILWSDQRSNFEVAELKTNRGNCLEETTLNEASCTWTLPQLLWVRRHEPEAFNRVRGLLGSKDYLVFRLTGQAYMDHASAAATLMLDARTKTWSPQLNALSGLTQDSFPRLVHATTTVGTVTDEAARAFALPPGVPVIAGTLDSAAELVGCGILAPGKAGMIRVGSAGGIMTVTDTPKFDPGIITYPHVIDGMYYKQAGTNSCATSLKWLRDLGAAMRLADSPPITYADMDRLVRQTDPGANGLMFHPYLQGERAPYWNPELRGSFTGIAYSHGWPQITRAVMEGVAFSLLDGLRMFRRNGLNMTTVVMTGGVVKSEVWSQIITDALGMQTRTIQQGDSAFGVCLIAATAVGMFANINEAVAVCVKDAGAMVPDAANHDRYQRLFARYQEVANFLDEMARKYGTEM